MSDTSLAEYVGVDVKTVGRYRKELQATMEIPESTERTGRDGRTINTEKIGKTPKAELAMIDENIQRRKLSALEEGDALARRKEIYLALHPDTKHGGAPGKPGGGKEAKNDNLPSFAEDASEKTGKSRRTVERSVELAEAICQAAKTTGHGRVSGKFPNPYIAVLHH